MNGDTLYALRDLLDWNERAMAWELGLGGKRAAQAVHEMEKGKRLISDRVSNYAISLASRHGYELSQNTWVRTDDR